MVGQLDSRENLVGSWKELFRGRLGLLVVGLLLVQLASAMQMFTIYTILPEVTRQLGGQEFYGWALAAGTLPSLAVVTLTPALAKIMGRRNLLLVATLLFCLGGITATLAPTFTTFIAGRVIQAVSSGVLAMFGLSAVARAVPESLRSRVFSLMSAMWIVPALIGPPFSAFIAEFLSWRWSIGMLIPLLLIGRLMLMGQASIFDSQNLVGQRIPLLSLVFLLTGVGLVLLGTSVDSELAFAGVVGGVVLALVAGVKIIPRETHGPTRTLILSLLFLTFAFYGADGMISLLAIEGLGSGMAQAGIGLTLGTVSWALASMGQPRLAEVLPGAHASTLAIGTTVLFIALIFLPVLVMSSLATAIGVAVLWVLCTIAGIGMGIAYPSVMTATLGKATAADSERLASSIVLAEMIGGSLSLSLVGGLYSYGLRIGISSDHSLAGALLILVIGALAALIGAMRGRFLILKNTSSKKCSSIDE